MPGIVGLITKMPRERAEPLLRRMVEAMRHESFYVTGTWIDESLGVYVGWVARKNSFADGMPLANERGDVCLVVSGEDYSDAGSASRQNGGRRGPEAMGPSYLLPLYEQDPAFPESLNGRFHGLVADRQRGTAILFNDRYGMHRLHYHEAADAFYFAAEAKAILAVCPELRAADPQGLGEFVACGCVLENRTLFRGIQVLPPASAWSFRAGAIAQKNIYFDVKEWENQSPLDPESYYQELRGAFSRNLGRYFQGRDPMAISLTGGLDTRMIMAWHKPAPHTLPCYTYGGAFRDNHDVRIARKIAQMCGQSHTVIEVGEEFLSRFAHYAERSVYLSDGCIDLSRSPDLYVSEKAREIAPVRLVGTYGSEVLTQVPMFKPVRPLPGLFSPELLADVQRAETTYAAVRREHPVTFAAFRQSPWWHYGVLALEQTQLTVRSPYLDNDFVRAVFRAPKSNLPQSDVRLRLIRDGSPSLAAIPTDRGLGGDSGRLASLAKRSLLEFTFKADYAYDYGMPHWMARVDHWFAPLHFERLFLGRHKLIHFRYWYREALADYVRQMLLDPRTLSRPYLEPNAVQAVVNGHLKGERNYTNEIHKVLTLELIHRLFLDSTA
ncbi:MAG: asparagine synthase-related protein [Terriglobales bacterium]